MTATRPRAFTVLAGAAVLAAGLTACGLLPPTKVTTTGLRRCILQVSAPSSVVVALIDRDERHIRAQVKAMLLTAPPNAHIILRDLDTGDRLGSFTTPRGSALPAPIPPAPLPPDPTQVQSYAYHQAITKYDTALGADQALLNHRWTVRLTAWASRITSKAAEAAENGPQQLPELSGFTRGLAGAVADISSLEHIPGIHLGGRKILAILDLDVVPTASAPPLPGGLQGVTVAITGFTGSPRAQATWRKQLAHAGVRQTVLMTPATTDELSAVTDPVLSQPASHRRPRSC